MSDIAGRVAKLEGHRESARIVIWQELNENREQAVARWRDQSSERADLDLSAAHITFISWEVGPQ